MDTEVSLVVNGKAVFFRKKCESQGCIRVKFGIDFRIFSSNNLHLLTGVFYFEKEEKNRILGLLSRIRHLVLF